MRKTRRALREALFGLLRERGWAAVNVQEVCDRADVARSTFYAHFADREDLLLSGFEELKAELRAGDPRPFGFVRGLVEHVDVNRDLARRLSGRRGGPPWRRRLNELLLGLVDEELARLAPPSAHRAVAARFLSGALLELLQGRLEGGVQLDADELAALFVRLSGPILRELSPA